MSSFFYWEEQQVPFTEGESIGYALFRQTKLNIQLGSSPAKQNYSLFCGIGACQGCLVYVEGLGITESCIIRACKDMRVRPCNADDRLNHKPEADYHE